MTREPGLKRDQREITIPSDARPLARGRLASAGTRRSAWTSAIASGRSGIALCRRRLGEILTALAALAAVGTVSLNALGSQSGRHPAPILANLSAKPVPSKKPVEASALDAKTKIEPRAEAKGTNRPEPTRDGIAEMIRSGEAARADDTTASVTPKPSPKEAVALAQRALVKLGYGPLKTDGVLGPGTRAAISRFERDAKLPVKGDPAGRTLRELAARAGLPQG